MRTLLLLVATSVALTACSSNDKDPAPPMGNTAPLISLVPEQAVDQDTQISVPFSVSDAQSGPTALMVTASLDSTSLIPADGVALSGTDSGRALVLSPLEAATGMATVTLTVTDPDGASASRSFRVTVRERRASFRSTALDTFAKAEDVDATPVNGFTFEQDADDAALFEPLVGTGE
jgi:hypothetical protein